MNQIIKRIFRGKGIYILLVLFLLVTIMQVFGELSLGAVAEINDTNTLPKIGANMPFQLMRFSDNIFYFLIPMIVFIVSTQITI